MRSDDSVAFVEGVPKVDYTVQRLGEAKIPSPIVMSDVYGDGIANYVSDDERILCSLDS